MALTPAQRMRRYRAKKAGGKISNGKNMNKSAKLYLDEETQELVNLLKCGAQNENLEQLFKRALFALSQTHFEMLLSSDDTETALAENLQVVTEDGDTLLATMNRLQGKILLLESEYITPLKETVQQLQKKKAELLDHINKLQQQNKRLRKTALHFRQQRDEALQNSAITEADREILWQRMALPLPGAARSEQREIFLRWLKAQRSVPYSLAEIAEVLHQAKIPTPSGKAQWSGDVLRALLKRG